MAHVQFDKVVEDVKALSPAQQQQLRVLLDTILAPAVPQLTEEEFERKLVEAGVARNGRTPPRQQDSRRKGWLGVYWHIQAALRFAASRCCRFARRFLPPGFFPASNNPYTPFLLAGNMPRRGRSRRRMQTGGP